MSNTPKVDAKAFFVWRGSADSQPMHVVRVDDARELERELSRALRVVEAARELAANCEEYEFDDGLGYAAQGMWWHDLDNALEEWEAGR